MALSRIVINTPLTATQDLGRARFNGTGSRRNGFALLSWLRGFIKGTRTGNMRIKVGAVQATATITSTGTATNAETMTICNVTFTAVTSGAAGNQFNISATPNTQADSMVTAFNASANLTGKVTAARTGTGIVTLTSVVPGLVGNGLDLTESLSNVTKTAFTGGTDGTAFDLTLGQLIS
jgi:hypothetical protein